MLPSKIPIIIFGAIIGGSAIVGMFLLTIIIGFILDGGSVTPEWMTKVLFCLFLTGALVSAGITWSATRKFEKDAIKRFKLD